jgi:type II secretory pathway pseudopilin PulG
MKPHPAQIRAFSLIEVVLAVGIFSLLGIGLVGILASGIGVAQSARSDYRLHLISERLQQRFLSDARWLEDQNKTLLFLDANGDTVDQAGAVWTLHLRKIDNPNWASPHLQTFLAELRSQSGEILHRFTLARAVSRRNPSP